MKPGKLFTHLHASYEGEKAAKGREGFWAIDAEAQLAANQWQMLMGAAGSAGGREVEGRQGRGREVGNSSADFSK